MHLTPLGHSTDIGLGHSTDIGSSKEYQQSGLLEK